MSEENQKNCEEKCVNVRVKNKTNRMYGRKYFGMNGNNVIEKKPRQMGETCSSKLCKKSALRQCSLFCEDKRKEIFDLFWKMSWEQKKLYVINLVETSNRKRIYAENSTRSISNFYFLKLNSNRIPVCQKMFLSTLGITQKMVRIWKASSGLHCTPAISEKQNKVPNNCKKRYDDRLNFLKKWLDGIPKLESHYRRRYSKKLYFEADFKSYRQIYDLYIEECRHQKENEISQVSFPKFMDVLKAGNYGLFKPRNDECDLCVSFKSKNVSKDEYENHRSEIEKMRNEKLNDIENARSGLCLLFCIDMQAVKLVPQTNANSSYYKMKLQVHNFTVYNVITHESDNYIWDETEGALTSSYFATCIINHLEKVISQSPEFHHIIIYSDGCCYQNRNAILANALLLFCTEKNVTIEQKYLVVGHTQMECDATHSLIERKVKNMQVNLPSQLVDIIKSARKTPFSLNAHLLNHAHFCNYDAIPKRYTSIRTGRKSGDDTVNMIRALAYDPTGVIYFKTNIENEYQQLPQRTKKDFVVEQPSQLHKERLKISKKKWQHLQDLKRLIPADCHLFYDNIPFED